MYHINYQRNEEELCRLELASLFNIELGKKVFNAPRKIEPSISPFIKKRLRVIHEAEEFDYLLKLLDRNPISKQGFKVEYSAFYKEDPLVKKAKFYAKEVGLRIIGFPSYQAPVITYGVTCYEGVWYFGELLVNGMGWKKHKKKPYTYSSSCDSILAKALINIVSKGDRTKYLIDPCCGVGTVLLEGEYSGYQIEGWEIQEKVAENARLNLEYFGYDSRVTTGNMNDIVDTFDGAIIDLPYGNLCETTLENKKSIISHGLRIAKKAAIVASKDIMDLLKAEGVVVLNHCLVGKNKKGDFYRYVYVCEKV